MDERLERHLCNLHNEVFEAAESRINTEFPHYTWGYIERQGVWGLQGGVPSLYVRVYQQNPYNSDTLQAFPHYTWGYIGLCTWTITRPRVPSLYVRVYRRFCCPSSRNPCSLTIREGISTPAKSPLYVSQFPHYTWGYIGERMSTKKQQSVPSLYVRVYRPICSYSPYIHSSLTIRDGISGDSGSFTSRISVPSLYVRVYHRVLCIRYADSCSLTIREGIS